jgi:hypothetical protein
MRTRIITALVVGAVVAVVAAFAVAGTPSARTGAAPGETVVWAVGDLCDDDNVPQPDCSAVGDLIAADSGLDRFLMLGDAQYEIGSSSAFNRYYDPKVGSKLNAFTAPVPGNHEYLTPEAAGYFQYFGSRAGDPTRGYYSFVANEWRVIAVNSNCGKVGGCGRTTTQGVWLRGQLAQPERCELIFGHHPPITDGKYAPGVSSAKNFHNMAYDGAAELLLTAHDHNYQRFAPMNKSFASDPERGVVNIVSGAGGEENVPWKQAARSAYRQNSSFGAVRIVLTATGYSGEYRAIDGRVMDTFSGSCR